MLVSWNWLKEYLGDTDLTAKQAADLLGLHAFEIEEIEEKNGDTVIDIDILPNRASDCLCHRGIARELASITGESLHYDPLKPRSSDDLGLRGVDLIEVDIKNSDACPRFTASLIIDVEVKESPSWLKKRLEAIGQRPINNIVDATNYVMFAIGQPIHAYDADLFPQVDGKWQFQVRCARKGETVSLIAEGGKDGDRVVELNGSELLIVDKSSDTPIGLAGVKGGRFAGVHEGTTKVIIEAAHFHPTITRKTARRLGIVIDASKRFENEPSRELLSYAQKETIDLITKIAGGSYVGSIDEYLERQDNSQVKVSINKTNSLLGLALTAEEMQNILINAGCEASLEGDVLTATGPFERTDLSIEEDFIEEIGRLYGYDHVESIVPTKVTLKEFNKRHYYGELVRQALVEQGFSEVITSSFRNKDKTQLLNALASDKSYVRSALTKNIQGVLDKNSSLVDLLGNFDTRVFEIGTVFYPARGSVAEHLSLALGVRVGQSSYTGKEDKVLQAAVNSVHAALGTELDWQIDKGVAEVNLDMAIADLPTPERFVAVEMGRDLHYKPFSVYPYMTRDIALWVEIGVGADEVEAVLNETAGDLRVRTTLFDRFEKDGRVSYGFRLVFQSNEKTLTDDEVNSIMTSVYRSINTKGWETR
ncbi:hypothetical protein CL653_02170 [bacterium]|nr:hypothetical protein [bacterium]